MPNPVDLTTIANVRSWLSSNGKPSSDVTDNGNIQSLITAVSIDFLRRTGRGPQNNAVPVQSPFCQAVVYSETYDGNGNDRLFLRNWPILSVASLSISGVAASQSTSAAMPGFQIDASGRSLSFQGAGGGAWLSGSRCLFGAGAASRFARGVGNVQVTYTAGFAEQPVAGELQTIPVSGALTVTAQQAPWISGISVAYFSTGAPLTQVFVAPAAGEYFIQSPGVYLFAEADAGARILLDYNIAGTPADLEMACRRTVGIHYSRARRRDQASRAMANGAGTESYRNFELTPEDLEVLRNFTRSSRS
jgi:hypothetical protein